MKERPILFSAPMVRALLDGSKTQTRRPCKAMNAWVDQECREVRMVDGLPHHFLKNATAPMEKLHCPYGQPGDRLYVRETFGEVYDWCDHPEMPGAPTERWHIEWKYRADGEPDRPHLEGAWTGWKPSIHMPKTASRILLEVISVRVERLQDISAADAVAEGVEPNWCGDLTKGPNGFGEQGWVPDCGWINYLSGPDGEEAYTAVESYQSLWESINGAGIWDANPWVWVVEFKRVATTPGRE